jgi:hypothetical protein
MTIPQKPHKRKSNSAAKKRRRLVGQRRCLFLFIQDGFQDQLGPSSLANRISYFVGTVLIVFKMRETIW